MTSERIFPRHLGARLGDTLTVRRSGVYGWSIRRCLGSWANHDGTICQQSTGRCGVAEALSPRFVFTPWDDYLDEIKDGKTSVAILRPTGITSEQSADVAINAIQMCDDAPKYDWTAITRIWFNIILRTNRIRQHEWEWYCTEAVQNHHARVSPELDVWGKKLPTPMTTQKRFLEGKLELIAELGKDKFFESMLKQQEQNT